MVARPVRSSLDGVVLATPEPDRERVIEGLSTSEIAGTDLDVKALHKLVGKIRPRWFLARDVHTGGAPFLLQPRHAMSLLRGPQTRAELSAALRTSAADPAACVLRRRVET